MFVHSQLLQAVSGGQQLRHVGAPAHRAANFALQETTQPRQPQRVRLMIQDAPIPKPVPGIEYSTNTCKICGNTVCVLTVCI